jgi:hypothetical protein
MLLAKYLVDMMKRNEYPMVSPGKTIEEMEKRPRIYADASWDGHERIMHMKNKSS